MIHFNIPPATGDELVYLEQAIQSGKICGDGDFYQKVQFLDGAALSCPEGSAHHQQHHRAGYGNDSLWAPARG